jgi:flagellar biogenesis protein FliO
MTDTYTIRRCLLLALVGFLALSTASAQDPAGAAPGQLIPPLNTLSQSPVSPIPLRAEPVRTPEEKPPNWDAFDALYEGENTDADPVAASVGQDTPPPATHFEWSQTDYLQYIGAIFFLCAAIILLGYLLRRFGKRMPAFAGPSLGKILGTVYLAPKVALHYVHSGDRILVIGVTANAMTLITEFDAATFRGTEATDDNEKTPDELNRFKALLSDNLAAGSDAANREPEDIAALRGDIARLQQTLREGVRGAGE